MRKDKKNSTKKKLVSAAAMLALSTAMLGSSTYAWFTMNKTVTVTGMEVKTKVGDNLLISHVTGTGVAKNAENTFITSDTTSIKAWLEPVSTNTAAATNFWYTLDAKADGSKLAADTNYLDYDSVGLGDGTDTTNYANKFSQDYGVTKDEVTTFGATTSPNNGAVGYVDYTFQLKAVNTNSTAQEIHLTQLDLLYDGTEAPVEDAFRVAVFCEPEAATHTDDSDYFAAGGTTLKKFYKTTAANYFTAKSGASAADTVTAITTFADETSSDNKLASVPGDTTAYYNVVVRLWIEGEDTTCNSTTFAELTQKWSLNLRLDLGAPSSGAVNGNTIVNNLTIDHDNSNN
jgi:hypothetical protein